MNEIARLAAEINLRHEAQRSAITDAARVVAEFDATRRLAMEKFADLSNTGISEARRLAMEKLTDFPDTGLDAARRLAMEKMADLADTGLSETRRLAMEKLATLEDSGLEASRRLAMERLAALEHTSIEAERRAMLEPMRMMEAERRAMLEPMRMIEAQQKAFERSIAGITAFASIDPWKHFDGLTSEIDRVQRQVSEISNRYSSTSVNLREMALLPSFAGTDHICQTLRLSQLWEGAGKSIAPLASSIACTGQQVAVQDEQILQYPAIFNLDTIEESEDTELAIFPSQNLFQVQRAELVLCIRRSPDALEDPEIIDSLPSFAYTKTAQSVCALIPLINQQCAARGEVEIFKPTNQLIRALVTLPNLIAVSRDLFAQFIDCLYFMVYEGAGKDNLRFMGLVQPAVAEPVWRIKHFRNLDLRHDVEHGKEKEIEKKQRELGQDYLQLIGVPTPRTRRDYRNAQLVLLKQVDTMLRQISDAIQALPPPNTAAKP